MKKYKTILPPITFLKH